MSYEGFVEFICEKGHYSTYDAYEEDSDKCRHCGSKMKYRHSVDQTNGYGENEQNIDDYSDDNGNPYTGAERDRIIYSDQRAPKNIIGFEDIEKVDKYGNKYVDDIKLYKPDNIVWIEI